MVIMFNMENLIGRKFGELSVIKRAKHPKYRGVHYLCHCSCGKEAIVRANRLKKGEIKSCGCKRCPDISGQVINNLTVLKKLKFNKGHTYYLCRCVCGNEAKIRSDCLNNGTAIDCGCGKSERQSKNQRQDLTGKRFGRWSVLYWEGKRHNGNCNNRYWCKCDCGTERSVIGGTLTSGTSISCGCYNREISRENYNDLTGQTFGRLTVIKKVASKKNIGTIWQCKCSCGTIKNISAQAMVNGHTQSCGCYNISEEKYLKLSAKKLGIDVSLVPLYRKYVVHAPYTDKFYDQDFRNQIWQEQNGVCPVCGKATKRKSFDLHHINYFKWDDSRENLMFLCDSCHSKTGTNRNYWTERLSELQPYYPKYQE